MQTYSQFNHCFASGAVGSRRSSGGGTSAPSTGCNDRRGRRGASGSAAGFDSRTSGNCSGSSSGFASGGLASLSARLGQAPLLRRDLTQLVPIATGVGLGQLAVAAVQVFLQDLQQLELRKDLVAVLPAAALLTAAAGAASLIARLVAWLGFILERREQLRKPQLGPPPAPSRSGCRCAAARATRRRDASASRRRPAPGGSLR